MDKEQYSIGELSELLGISRRTVRFYVQRELIPKPVGLGRSTYYTDEHLNKLKEIARLQDMGLALDSISQILNGELSEETAVENSRPVSRGQRSRKGVFIEQWIKMKFNKGIELHIDTAEVGPSAEQLEALQKSINEIFNLNTGEEK